MSLRVQCLAVDADDPVMLARWWAEVLGWRVTVEDPDESCIEPPAGSPEDGVSPDILFLKVPEGTLSQVRSQAWQVKTPL